MLEVAAAREIVLRHAVPMPAVEVPLSSAVLGHVLGEAVTADRDSPPFRKSMMDGYAVRSADCTGSVELSIVEEIAAGAVPQKNVGPGEAARIFTGAAMPDGADAVVMQERTEALPDRRVRVGDTALSPGRNVIPRGGEMTAGQTVLAVGDVLTPQAFGLLATVGRIAAKLVPSPRVGVLATGNELVPAGAEPAPGQIRNSNGPMLLALVQRGGGIPTDFGIAIDDPEKLRSAIQLGLEQSDVLVLTGGVSVGTYDLVPGVLADLDVRAHFHKVRMKPGKPLLFGTRGEKLVFGLPGNPVSSFACFELFVRPAIRAMAGHRDPGPTTTRLPLAEPLTANHDRPTFHPGVIEYRRAGVSVRPLAWGGSADLRSATMANALIVLPPGPVSLASGEPVETVVAGLV